jgi:hypothetical protein
MGLYGRPGEPPGKGGDDNCGCRVLVVIVFSSVVDVVADIVRDDVSHRATNNDDDHSAAVVVVAP